MKPSIHYIVCAKLFRTTSSVPDKNIELSQDFIEDNPIFARMKAFRYYQNYIDVLMDSKGKAYRSDKQARSELTCFYCSDSIEYSDYGIAIFMIIDESINIHNKKGDRVLIHGIGGLFGCSDSPESLILGLETEFEYYQHFGYLSKQQEVEVVFCDSNEWLEGYRDDEPSKYIVLDTPFDWTGLDKPYWWVEAT